MGSGQADTILQHYQGDGLVSHSFLVGAFSERTQGAAEGASVEFIMVCQDEVTLLL